MIEFESISKGKVSVMAHLGQKKMRLKHGLFMIEGRKSVEDLLISYSSCFDVEYIVADEGWLEHRGAEVMKASGLDAGRFFLASEQQLRRISTLSTPPEVVAVCRLPQTESTDSLLEHPLPPDLYLLLDGVQDPGNLGTIIRSAHWFGIRRIFCSPTTADIYNSKTIQASMASLAAVRVDYLDLQSLINVNPQIPVAGLLLEGDDIFTTPLPSAAFIVMGNEGNGISQELQRSVTLPLTIPPFDPSSHAESLNVAVATAVTLAQFRHPASQASPHTSSPAPFPKA